MQIYCWNRRARSLTFVAGFTFAKYAFSCCAASVVSNSDVGSSAFGGSPSDTMLQTELLSELGEVLHLAGLLCC